MASSPESRAARADELPAEASAGILAPGTPAGEYIIGRKLGAGAFGEVYAGEHPLIGKRVAIKVLNERFASDPEMVARFMVEARAVNRIRQRNIIDIFAFGLLAESRRPYFAMELLEGQTLGQLLAQQGRLPTRTALSLAKDIAAALDAVHEAGITHRDLKPDNVFLTTERDGGRSSFGVKLLDFGIAKLVGDDMAHRTAAGAVMGTPRYMSPEQARGKRADARSDVYSLGVMIHEMLTGTTPFRGGTTVDVLAKHVSEPPPPMSSVCPDLPVELDAPVLAMLEKRAKDRPNTAGEAVAAFATRVEKLGLAGAKRAASPRATGASDVTTAVLPIGWMPPDAAVSSGTDAAPARSAPSTPRAGDGDDMDRTVLAGSLMHDTDPTAMADTDSAIILPRIRRVWGAGAVGLAIATVVVVWSFERSPPRARASTIDDRAPAVAPVVAALPAPAASAPVVTPTPEAPAETIALRVSTRPPNVDLWLGDAKLGSSAAPVMVRRGGEPVTIVLKKTGFKDLRLGFTPDRDQSLDASLAPVAQPGPSVRAAGPVTTGPGLDGNVEKVLGGRD